MQEHTIIVPGIREQDCNAFLGLYGYMFDDSDHLDILLLHMEIVHATGSENESKEMHMSASISSYNYTFISFSLQYIYPYRP